MLANFSYIYLLISSIYLLSKMTIFSLNETAYAKHIAKFLNYPKPELAARIGLIFESLLWPFAMIKKEP